MPGIFGARARGPHSAIMAIAAPNWHGLFGTVKAHLIIQKRSSRWEYISAIVEAISGALETAPRSHGVTRTSCSAVVFGALRLPADSKSRAVGPPNTFRAPASLEQAAHPLPEPRERAVASRAFSRKHSSAKQQDDRHRPAPPLEARPKNEDPRDLAERERCGRARGTARGLFICFDDRRARDGPAGGHGLAHRGLGSPRAFYFFRRG